MSSDYITFDRNNLKVPHLPCLQLLTYKSNASYVMFRCIYGYPLHKTSCTGSLVTVNKQKNYIYQPKY